MLLAIEGAAGAGKTTLRDRLIAAAEDHGIAVAHIGQFSWLSLDATRVLVALRAGRPPADEDVALTAAINDLALHADHNLGLARDEAHIVADRLVLSSACLLALRYDTPVERYIEQFAAVPAARPEATFVLTTPPAVCARRVATRPTAPRPVERPGAATRLAGLYVRAADAWAELTDGVVWRHPAVEPSDLDLMVSEAIDTLRSGESHPHGALSGEGR